MDVDEQHHTHNFNDNTNAVAGPSNITPPPELYLPPPAPQSQSTSHLRSTQDLLARFSLLSAYDRYVRPHALPVDGHDHPPTPGGPDKGKGKEKEFATATPDDGQDGDDDEGGKGDKKKKNSYKHLIKGIPGKHSMKKDDYLATIMQVPPKQRIAITPFDQKTQREAFSVSLEGLKGWNVNTLVIESAQAREDRKKRKELKKLAKANVGGVGTPSATSPPAGGTYVAPTPGSSTGPVPARTSTPKPNRPPVQIPNGNDNNGRVGTPKPTPTSAVSQQASIPSAGNGARPGTPTTEKRGMKRNLEEATRQLTNSGGQGPGTQNQNLNSKPNGNGPGAAATKGSGGVRPRPMKKQRTDVAGHAREMPVQQPTPQGV